MIANRRTYYFHPSKIEAGVTVLRDMVEQTMQATGRSFKAMRCLHGPIHALVFDMRFRDETDMKQFSDVWYPMLIEKDLIARWFTNVKQMVTEMWSFPNAANAGKDEIPDQVDGAWGPITHRMAFQPYASSYNSAMEAAAQIVSKTRERFQKDLVLSQCYVGANKIAFETNFDGTEPQSLFADAWMRWLESDALFASFFDNIQEGTSELWQTIN